MRNAPSWHSTIQTLLLRKVMIHLFPSMGRIPVTKPQWSCSSLKTFRVCPFVSYMLSWLMEPSQKRLSLSMCREEMKGERSESNAWKCELKQLRWVSYRNTLSFVKR